ncbi:MAG: hypothetical protein QM731_08270 [Chitinophagaceae bacterium]
MSTRRKAFISIYVVPLGLLVVIIAICIIRYDRSWWPFPAGLLISFILRLWISPAHYIYALAITADAITLDYFSTPFFKKKTKELVLADVQDTEITQRNWFTGDPTAVNFKYRGTWLTLHITGKAMFQSISKQVTEFKSKATPATV